jgi:Tfp pilus assembly protein FimT
MALRARQTGFSVVELLLVLALVGLLTALVLPGADPAAHEQLDAASQALAADLALARSLAVSNGSSYRVSFDVPQNQYTIEHTGGNAQLLILPASPFHRRNASHTQLICALSDLPGLGGTPRLVLAHAGSDAAQALTHVEFGPLGATTQTDDTRVWLAVGAGGGARYQDVRVQAATGMASVGQMQAASPSPAVDGQDPGAVVPGGTSVPPLGGP